MLTFVPTPIGNIEDISFRSINVLKEAGLILCEDTRVTKKLLNLITLKLNIIFDKKEFISLHSHNEQAFLISQNKELLENKNVVYLSDAGMPCVSDPGALLVDFCIKNNIKYDILPGANAFLTAYAMSGFNQKEFLFFGFLSHKGKDRQNQLEDIMQNKFITILYESPHRLLKLLNEIETIDATREIFVVKELTKMYQFSLKGSVKQINSQLKQTQIKGEWVIVINSSNNNKGSPIVLNDIENLKLPPKQKAKLISKLTGKNIQEIYNTISNNI